jgi:ATP-dependent helicase/nuclease subunit A
VLTERYLSNLRDDGAEVGQIVAITFTDRAARQMRERIRKAVLHHVQDAVSPEEADRWARYLRGLETAQISTIHAFCANLLRQHAVEAGLDPHFGVLEDVLSVNLEGEALHSCLQRLLTAPTEAGADLCELVKLHGWSPVVLAVEHLMRTWDEPGWNAWRQQTSADIAAGWQHYARGQLLPRYLEYLAAARPKIARCLWLLRTTPPLPGSKMAANAQVLLAELPRLAAARNLADAVEQLVEAAKVGPEKAKAWPSEEIYQAVRDALADFREDIRAQNLEQYAAAPEDLPAEAVAGHRFLRVADEAARAYRELKHQRGVVDFQDLLVLARNLLRDHAEVRERVQRRIRYLLIDELQDTDPVQMELVRDLCGAELTTGKLFTVGDHSQSIYRFRGANVHLFRDLRQTMPHEGRLGLTVNFRSQPALLDFTNALLGHRLEAYEPLVAHHAQVNPGPCVEFLWSPWEAKENVTEGRIHEATLIAHRIAAMVGNEKLVVERKPEGEILRPVRLGDIVLLFRAMNNVHLYERALRDHGLDYYLVGGRAFFAQQEIYDLLNLLRALENPQDAVSLAGTLRSPFCCLSDEALYVLGRFKQGLWAGLHDQATCQQMPGDQQGAADRARRHLDRWRSLKDRLPIARLLGEVFADSGYDACMQLESLGDRKLANLWKLLDLARTFDRSGLFGLAEFIDRLGDLVRSQPREEQAATQPENADVVRLMTIHQAKGLEFPVVFVPDLAAKGRDSSVPVAHWDAQLGCVVRPPADEEPPPFPPFATKLWNAWEAVECWHEDLRTLYVACTRAQDYLVLSAALRRPYGPSTTWMLTLAERFDLATGACLVAGLPPERTPRVRVWDGQKSEALPGPLWTTPLAPVTHTVRAEGQMLAVAPVPVRLAKKRIFTVRELESYWESVAVTSTSPDTFGSRDFCCQFNAEDGSDRRAWMAPSERVGGLPVLPEESILRQVLEQWDYPDEVGWGGPLDALLKAEPGFDGHSAQRQELAAILTRFAESETRRHLAAARICYRNLEFLVDWRNPGSPLLRGLIDCLWQDAKGAWHLLAFTSRRVPADLEEGCWQRRKPGLVLGAWAIERQFGTRPRSITLYGLHEGTAKTFNSRSFQQRKVLAAVDAALMAIAGQLLKD